MAAVLAAGDGAVLSHRSAAALWRMRGAGRGSIDVITPRHRRCSARLQVHEVALAADEVTLERGIPVTTPARTLLDLAIVVGPEQLNAAFDQAEYRRLGSATSVETLLARYPGRPGTRPLRRVLEDHRRNGETVTRSLLERRLLALVAKHGLPRPRINRVGPRASSTPDGPSSGWSSSATASPPTARAGHSSTTARGTAPSRWPGGASSGSRGASSRTTPMSSRGSSRRCSPARRARLLPRTSAGRPLRPARRLDAGPATTRLPGEPRADHVALRGRRPGPPPRRRRPRRRPGRRAGTSPPGTSGRASAGAGSRWSRSGRADSRRRDGSPPRSRLGGRGPSPARCARARGSTRPPRPPAPR